MAIIGGTGGETITGGTGADVITLGAVGTGSDSINYNATQLINPHFGDTIRNFDTAHDTIFFNNLLEGGVAPEAIQSGHFSSFAATPGISQAFYDATTHILHVDTTGAAGAGDMAITLTGISGTVTDANFVWS